MAPLVIGHRGAAALAAENTFEAFEKATEQGVTWVETDIRATADGALVLRHDLLLEGRRLDRMSLADARDARHDIPTLGETLARFGNALHFNLELKEAGLAPRVATEVQTRGLEHRVVISSFHHRELQRSMALLPMVRHAPLISERPICLSRMLEGLVGVSIIVAQADFVDASLVEEARDLGAVVWVYNALSPRLLELEEIGVVGFIVDDPVTALDIFARGAGRRKVSECDSESSV